MTNQSIIAVPTSFASLGEVRQFLLKLVETIDIALGYRGEKPEVAAVEIPNIIASISYDDEELAATIALASETAETLNQVILALKDLGALKRD